MDLRVCRTSAITVGTVVFVAALPLRTFGQELPAVQAGGGYIHVMHPYAIVQTPAGTDGAGPAWFGEVVGNVDDHVAIVGQAAVGFYDAPGSRSQPGRARIESYLAGGRIRSRCCGLAMPFAHAMVGRLRSRWHFDPEAAGTSSAYSYWGFSYGGGVDIAEFHVAADLMNGRKPFNSEWTFRIVIGALFPGPR